MTGNERLDAAIIAALEERDALREQLAAARERVAELELLLTHTGLLKAQEEHNALRARVAELTAEADNERARSRTLVNAATVATERAERAEASDAAWKILCGGKQKIIDALQADLAAARALHNALLPGYCASTGISDNSGHAITIHYATREDMDRAHAALCEAVDAALGGTKHEPT